MNDDTMSISTVTAVSTVTVMTGPNRLWSPNMFRFMKWPTNVYMHSMTNAHHAIMPIAGVAAISQSLSRGMVAACASTTNTSGAMTHTLYEPAATAYMA